MSYPKKDKCCPRSPITSLADIATSKDRVCVLNILGSESRTVTPISHAFSGANIVFGTAPGKRGAVLETPAGDIPVFDNVAQGLAEGLEFNTGVVYLPPSGVRDGVAELLTENPALEKIVVLTEKVSVHDAREIRSMAQAAGVQVFGANCLGVADSWQGVRIGGALGGKAPAESLLKGSVAIYSNSGNFTTTVANYLALSGWGTTTSISSGKDVYIHYAPDAFAKHFAADDRSQAAVLYIEPGGYYEKDVTFDKPVVTCVVGRWKAKLTRSVGHAGAIAGDGDNAMAKERWFMEKFGVDDIYTPEKPVFTAKGAVVTNISHIPEALTAVMGENGIKPDFEPKGDLSLKPWFANDCGLDLPQELQVDPVEALAPYNEQITALASKIGAEFPRQVMKDTSGASEMDVKTQVTRVHGLSVLDMAKKPLESNMLRAILREDADNKSVAVFNALMCDAVANTAESTVDAAKAAAKSGGAPNAVLGTACFLTGPEIVKDARTIASALICAYGARGQTVFDKASPKLDINALDNDVRALMRGNKPCERAQKLMAELRKQAIYTPFFDLLSDIGEDVTFAAVQAAACVNIAWAPLMKRRITKQTVANLPWYVALYGAMLSVMMTDEMRKTIANDGSNVTATELAAIALRNATPDDETKEAVELLAGLLVSNGPGTISAQGAKGAVAADGPQDPSRIHIHKAFVGFLTHSGFSHGGNGFEGIRFLIEQFKNSGLKNPGNKNHGIDLKAIAAAFVKNYAAEKKKRKAVGLPTLALPGINHPVFKGKPVNHDPRELFIAGLLAERGRYNVFHEFYRVLVQELYDQGVTRNVFCVNIDAVIAALLLKLFWADFVAGKATMAELEAAAFAVFLIGRMIGTAAEIEDHTSRGRNMDTRTKASLCRFVS